MLALDGDAPVVPWHGDARRMPLHELRSIETASMLVWAFDWSVIYVYRLEIC
jgi:hypothetical protein